MSLPSITLDQVDGEKPALDVDFHEAQTIIHVEDKVRIFGDKRMNAPSNELYATSEDFCRIFEKDMNRLYLLSLLLTADKDVAEKCFVRGLEDSKSGNPVFREWAESWARRAIIVNAIRMIGPRPGSSSPFARKASPKETLALPERYAAILDLPVFERFVFVMTVLEGYSPRDCRLLLNCSNFDIAEARAHALQQLGESAQLKASVANGAGSQSDSNDTGMALRRRFVAPLAASA